MNSTVLPNGRHSFLPQTPTDGQLFVDSDFVQWSFDAANNVWERCGIVDSIPIVSDTNAGLLSPQDKALLDGTPITPGGFGIIADTKLVLQNPSNLDGVISGDIKLRSESLEITCVGPDRLQLDCAIPPTFQCEGTTTASSGLQFSLRDRFINSIFVDVSGPAGKRGVRGPKGLTGRPGLSDGPAGRTGEQGEDIQSLCLLTNITFNDVEGLTDTAIVDLKVADDDGHGCKLVVTKAKLNLDASRPADKVLANGLSRTLIFRATTSPTNPTSPTFPTPPRSPGLPADDVEFNTEFQKFTSSASCGIARLDDWVLLKAPGDETPLNLNLIRVADGSNTSDQGVSFNATTTLNGFVTDIIDEYKARLTKIDEAWGREVKQYIESIDDKARGILSGLADQLAMCEFNLPAIEYCITWVNCEGAAPPADRSPGFPAATTPSETGNETNIGPDQTNIQ